MAVKKGSCTIRISNTHNTHARNTHTPHTTPAHHTHTHSHSYSLNQPTINAVCSRWNEFYQQYQSLQQWLRTMDVEMSNLNPFVNDMAAVRLQLEKQKVCMCVCVVCGCVVCVCVCVGVSV